MSPIGLECRWIIPILFVIGILVCHLNATWHLQSKSFPSNLKSLLHSPVPLPTLSVSYISSGRLSHSLLYCVFLPQVLTAKMSLSIGAAACMNAGAVCLQTGSPSFLGQKVSSNYSLASQRVCLGKRVSLRGVRCAVEDDVVIETSTEEHDIYPSGEWPANFSLSNYEDLSHHYSPAVFRKEAQPDTILADIMSTTIRSATPENTLSEVNHHFEVVTGLPVVGADMTCVGVISRKDVVKSPSGLDGKVKEVMSTPAITISADKTVQEAAVNMLKAKVHRLPVVNESNQVVGIVTRTDIFTALEGLPSRD